MAYRSYNQPQPYFRKVENQRGKTIDRMTKEMKIGRKYNPWKSIYTKDYNQYSKRNQSNPNGIGLRAGTANARNRNDLDNLNDAVSERSFEIRGEGIQPHKEMKSAMKNNFFNKHHNEYGDMPNKSKKIS